METPGERSVKHSILRSFETLIKGMDPSPEEPEQLREEDQPKAPEQPKAPPKPRTVTHEGVFLGRTWRRYSDGGFEGETVRGMQAFRDLDQFQAFVEASPVLRAERAARDSDEPATGAMAAADATAVEAMSAEDVGAAAATPSAADELPSASIRGNPHALADFAKPLASPADARLARDFVLAGGLGILLCAAWWLRFYVFGDLHGELLRRAIGGNAIRSTNLSVLRRLPCFFLNNESCVAMKSWGRFAGYLVYEPAFFWASICALGLGFLLIQVRKRQKKA
jgi:hypothetical protein